MLDLGPIDRDERELHGHEESVGQNQRECCDEGERGVDQDRREELEPGWAGRRAIGAVIVSTTAFATGRPGGGSRCQRGGVGGDDVLRCPA